MAPPDSINWAEVEVDPLAVLVGGPSSAFLSSTWERGPAVWRAAEAPQRAALVAALMPPLVLAAARAAAGEPLALGRDVVAMGSWRRGGQQGSCHSHSHSHSHSQDGSGDEAREAEGGPPATAEALRALLSRPGGGGSLALRQPQRFDDALWRLLAALERQLGCLVGAEAVAAAPPPPLLGAAHPEWAQGPHVEGCEVFVLQTQGSSVWRVFQPAPGGPPLELANARRAVPPAQLGPLALEAQLQPGDCLYLPRGAIRQWLPGSAAPGNGAGGGGGGGGASGHLLLTTYRRWSQADLVQFAVSVALANPSLQPRLPRPLKAGLPPGFLAAAALGAPAGGAGAAARALAAALRTFADAVGGGQQQAQGQEEEQEQRQGQQQQQQQPPFGEEVLRTAADAMAEDFMRGRLPPHPSQLLPRGPPPAALQDVVACRGAGLFRLVPLAAGDAPEPGSDPDSDCDPDPSASAGEGADCGGWLRLASCLGNSREEHMMGGDEGAGEEEAEDGGCCDDPGCGQPGHRHHHHHHHGHGRGGGESSSDDDEEEEEEGRGSAELGSSSDDSEGGQGGSGPAQAGGKQPGEGEEGEEACFPASFAPALTQLLAAAPPAGLRVADVLLPTPELRLELAAALWGAGVLATLPRRGGSGGGAGGGGRRSGGGLAAKRPRGD